MKNKKYLIVGVDPGITTGLCAIDLKGNIVKTYSSKRMGFEKIVSWINSIGVPVILACDVEVPPQILKKLSMQLKAKLFHPKKDMKVGEKQKLTEKIAVKDSHQRDSCAAALIAYKHYQPFFKKVDDYLSKIGKEELSDEIKKKLLFKEAKNIKDALKEKPEEINLQKKKRAKHIEKESEIKILKKIIKELKEKIEDLTNAIEKLKKEKESLREKLSAKKSNKELIQLAEKRKEAIKSLEEKILLQKIKISNMEKEMRKMEQEEKILKGFNCLIVKEAKNLSEDEILKKNLFKDILFVNELTLPSKETISFLKRRKVKYIIFKKGKSLSEEISSKGFKTIPSKEIKIEEENGVKFVKKDELERALKSREIIEKIIEEYRSKRKR